MISRTGPPPALRSHQIWGLALFGILLAPRALADLPEATEIDTTVGTPVSRSSGAGAEDERALQMTAELLDVDLEKRTATLSGGVRLSRGSTQITCEHVDAKFDLPMRITTAHASGGVSARMKGLQLDAPEADIDMVRQTVELRGGVVLRRAHAEMRAERASVDLATSVVKLRTVRGLFPLSAFAAGGP